MKLVIEDDEGHRRELPLDRDEITIGRKEDNLVHLPERNVSRRHARLLRRNGAVLLEDLQSANGTQVNGVRIQEAVPLQDGDLVKIGDYGVALRPDEVPLEMPPETYDTVALWFDVPENLCRRVALKGLDLPGGLHAVEHAAIGLLPLFAMCDRLDIGGLSTVNHPDTGKAQVFIYDAHPGGVGIAERGFDLIRELCETTLKAVRECPCQEGCPSCIQSPKCGNNNEPLDKRAAEILLAELISESLANQPATEE